MVQAPGIRVPTSEAEITRRRLHESGALRLDLHPLGDDDAIVFAVNEAPDVFDFRPRATRPQAYIDLLPEALHDAAPRAFDSMGDIAIIKVPDASWEHRHELGEALLQFLGARAVFHDAGVKGTFRVRELTRLAGAGDSETTVQENGVTLQVDVGKAYFSPRLASERARVAELVQPGETVVDLFGGVAPFAVQAAKRGAHVTSIDLNPDACEFAVRNAKANRVAVDVRCGDARAEANAIAKADRIIMNLPHGAGAFLDVAKQLLPQGGMVHYHEILQDDQKDARAAEVAAALGGRIALTRHVRNYAATESHWVLDVEVPA